MRLDDSRRLDQQVLLVQADARLWCCRRRRCGYTAIDRSQAHQIGLLVVELRWYLSIGIPNLNLLDLILRCLLLELLHLLDHLLHLCRHLLLSRAPLQVLRLLLLLVFADERTHLALDDRADLGLNGGVDCHSWNNVCTSLRYSPAASKHRSRSTLPIPTHIHTLLQLLFGIPFSLVLLLNLLHSIRLLTSSPSILRTL